MKKKYKTGQKSLGGQLLQTGVSFIPVAGQILAPLVGMADQQMDAQKAAEEQQKLLKQQQAVVMKNVNPYGNFKNGGPIDPIIVKDFQDPRYKEYKKKVADQATKEAHNARYIKKSMSPYFTDEQIDNIVKETGRPKEEVKAYWDKYVSRNNESMRTWLQEAIDKKHPDAELVRAKKGTVDLPNEDDFFDEKKQRYNTLNREGFYQLDKIDPVKLEYDINNLPASKSSLSSTPRGMPNLQIAHNLEVNGQLVPMTKKGYENTINSGTIEKEYTRPSRLAPNTKVLQYATGGILNDMFKQYNTGSHKSGNDLQVDTQGIPSPDGSNTVQNKENSYKVGDNQYVMSDALTNPKTGNKFNQDAMKINKKYPNARFQSDQKNALDLEMKNLSKVNDVMRQGKESKQMYIGGPILGNALRDATNYWKNQQYVSRDPGLWNMDPTDRNSWEGRSSKDKSKLGYDNLNTLFSPPPPWRRMTDDELSNVEWPSQLYMQQGDPNWKSKSTVTNTPSSNTLTQNGVSPEYYTALDPTNPVPQNKGVLSPKMEIPEDYTGIQPALDSTDPVPQNKGVLSSAPNSVLSPGDIAGREAEARYDAELAAKKASGEGILDTKTKDRDTTGVLDPKSANNIALGMKGLALAGSVYDALQPAEKEKLLTPNYSKSDAYMQSANIDFTQAKQDAMGVSNIGSNMNRSLSGNAAQYQGREQSRLAQLQDSLGRISEGENNAQSQLNLTRGTYEQQKAVDYSNREYANQQGNMQNQAAARGFGRQLASDLSQIGSSFNTYAESTKLNQNTQDMAKFTNSQIMATINAKNPNFKLNDNIVQNFLDGKMTLDETLSFVPQTPEDLAASRKILLEAQAKIKVKNGK